MVERARRLYAEGLNHTEIAHLLHKDGVRGRLGGRVDGRQVRRMLRLSQIMGVPLDEIPPEPPPNSSASSRVPYGWQRIDGRFIRDPGEQAVIARMRRMHRRGMSLQKIAERLNADGVPTKRGRLWWQSTILRILKEEGAVRLRAAGPKHHWSVPLLTTGRMRKLHPVPYGWMLRDYRLVESPAEQTVIARMKEMRKSGMGNKRIARQLTAEGVPPVRGRRWWDSTVKGILNNEGCVRARLLAESRVAAGD